MNCRHPKAKVVIYWSDDHLGYWAECPVCGAYTAAFEREEDALTALGNMERKKPSGSPTSRGGRPKTLPDDAKLRTLILCNSHVRRLEEYQQEHELRSKSEALRHLLENLL